MTSRYSIWMLLAGVAVGLVVGYLAGRGMFGGTPPGPHLLPGTLPVRRVSRWMLIPPTRQPLSPRACRLALQIKLHLVATVDGPGFVVLSA